VVRNSVGPKLGRAEDRKVRSSAEPKFGISELQTTLTLLTHSKQNKQGKIYHIIIPYFYHLISRQPWHSSCITSNYEGITTIIKKQKAHFIYSLGTSKS